LSVLDVGQLLSQVLDFVKFGIVIIVDFVKQGLLLNQAFIGFAYFIGQLVNLLVFLFEQ
jgi:hypothetical protein